MNTQVKNAGKGAPQKAPRKSLLLMRKFFSREGFHSIKYHSFLSAIERKLPYSYSDRINEIRGMIRAIHHLNVFLNTVFRDLIFDALEEDQLKEEELKEIIEELEVEDLKERGVI